MSSMAQAAQRTTSSASTTAASTAERGATERSRNARAQARHRAKRKAYIEQLEETVTKLQTAFGLTPEQVSALPPPQVKIRELEQENARLQKENEDMRRLLGDTNHRTHDSAPEYRRQSVGHYSDRQDYNKKRRLSDEELYLLPDPTHDIRPPPLTIPSNHGLTHSYHAIPSQNSSQGLSNNSSLFNLNAPTPSFHHALHHHQPQTPHSGSSSTSSPPFSPHAYYAPEHGFVVQQLRC